MSYEETNMTANGEREILTTSSLHRVTKDNLGAEDVQRIYDSWSNNYDEDCKKEEYNAPNFGAKKLSELLSNKKGRILDVACGTGLVAKELCLLGYTSFDGVDFSKNCLQIARKIGLYDQLKLCNVQTSGIPMDDNSYDALICVGAFLPGHINQSAFPEFCRVVKPGGIIVITIREEYIYTADVYNDGKLDLAIVQLVQDQKWDYLCRDRVDNLMGQYHGVIFGFRVR